MEHRGTDCTEGNTEKRAGRKESRECRIMN
jgi:hypothetical protein